MVVPGENGNAVARLPVPDANGLIVRSADNPRVFGVEKRRANVIQMP